MALAFPKPVSRAAAPAKDAETIGIDTLGYLAARDELMRRFLDVTGLEVGQLRAEAAKPAFFVGVLDFLLANEEDLVGAVGLDPAEIGRAHDAIDLGRSTRR